MYGWWCELRNAVIRKRRLETSLRSTTLKRCLNTADITLLGVGHMVGAGIYVLTGTITRNIAGPGVILSFLIAACVSLLSAFCFAEFAARYPNAGSTYIYTYLTVGELAAFTVGWNMVLDLTVGMAAVARAWSGYINGLTGGTLQPAIVSALRYAEWMKDFDLLAALTVVVFTALQAFGVRTSTNINSLFASINMFVMVFVSVYGLVYADFDNWNNFTPYGMSGVVTGAASAFVAFIGLDTISICSEESANPKFSIPRATMYALLVVSAGYLLLCVTLTLMVPYYLVSVDNALPWAFRYNDVYWAEYLVSVAALLGMGNVMFGGGYTAPRYIYAMAKDGLLFQSLSKVSPTTKVPLRALFISGLISTSMAFVLKIDNLIEFLSMGTLIGYTAIAMAVLILRYRSTQINEDGTIEENCIGGELRPMFSFFQPLMLQFQAEKLTSISICTFAASCLVLGLLASVVDSSSYHFVLLLSIPFAIVCLVCLGILLLFEQTVPRSFSVPLCPFVSLTSIAFNTLLISQLQLATWIRFIVWMLIGLGIYFCYGIRNSIAETHAEISRLIERDNAPSGAEWYDTESISKQPVISD